MTSAMLAVLCEHLLEKPDEDLDGMVLFIWDEFGKLLSLVDKKGAILCKLVT